MLGRILLTIDAFALLFGAILADWNETHVYNPRWPPHAKFHNAQTISLSVILGVATLFFTWRPFLSGSVSPSGTGGAGTVVGVGARPTRPEPQRQQLARESMRTAVFTGTIYWVAGLAASRFPGSSGLDPEFGGPGFPQRWLFGGMAAAALLGGLVLEA